MKNIIKFAINHFKKKSVMNKILYKYDRVKRELPVFCTYMEYGEGMYLFRESPELVPKYEFKIKGTDKIALMTIISAGKEDAEGFGTYDICLGTIGIKGEKLYADMTFEEFKESVLNSYMLNVKDLFIIN